METKFNFKSQICTTREQSERLLALGLKKETADMYYSPFYFENNLIDYFDAKVLGGSVREEMMAGYEEYKDYILAWSLHRLLCLYNVHYLEFMREEEIAGAYDIVIDAITQAIEGGYFNEKYLV